MRSEVRVGRPFLILPELVDLCSGSIISSGEVEHIQEGDGSVAIPRESADRIDSDLKFRLSFDPSILTKVTKEGVNIDALDVVLRIRIPILQYSEISHSCPLGSLADGNLEFQLKDVLTPLAASVIGAGGRATITSYLVVNDPTGVTKPTYSKGTWLSRAKFTFGSGGGGFSFAISPLDEPQYKEGVSRKAATYLQIAGDMVTSSIEALDVTVFVNKDLLSRLSSINSTSSTAIQRKLEVDVVSGLLARLVSDCQKHGVESWLDLQLQEGSAAIDVITNIAKVMKETEEEILVKLLGEQFLIVLTHLEAELGILDADLKALSPTRS